MAAAKWCDAMERMRKADKTRRRFREEECNTNGYFRACGESASASDALIALAEERLTTFCRELPGYDITKTDARLGDGTAVFEQYGNVYVVATFHMKHFHKGVFQSFQSFEAGVSWPSKGPKIGKRERRLAKTSFRLYRCYVDDHKELNDLTYDDFSEWGKGPDDINIPASALFMAEFGKEAARLVLFYSEEFRGLPLPIKRLILRKLY